MHPSSRSGLVMNGLSSPLCMRSTQVKECPGNFRAWVDEMAGYVKHLDPNHLVTIGEEGFFGEDRPEAVHNPQGWGGQIGQDFVLDHSSPSIDFATTHVWPDNWQRCAYALFPVSHVLSHICMRHLDASTPLGISTVECPGGR